MPKTKNSIKIAYALISYHAAYSGVYAKTLDQVIFWRSKGIEVQLFVITDEKSVSFWKAIDPHCVTLVDSKVLSKVTNRLRLVALAAKTNPDIVYLRESFPILLPRIIIPIVLEIQSIVGNELKIRSKGKYLLFAYIKKFIYSRISGAVFVTSELMIKNEFSLNDDVPKISIGNAINLNRIVPLTSNYQDNLNLIFVGSSSQSWQGISELVKFAELNSDIFVHIVGEKRESSLPNLTFYGQLEPSEYQQIAAQCVAGVGTLNLSAKLMEEGSALKVREYLAMGLPVIIRYRDVDLDESSKFVLRLPVDARTFSDFSLEVRTFLDSWRHKRVPKSAILHLDVSVKESKRLEFLHQVIETHGHFAKRRDKS